MNEKPCTRAPGIHMYAFTPDGETMYCGNCDLKVAIVSPICKHCGMKNRIFKEHFTDEFQCYGCYKSNKIWRQ